MSQVVDTVTWKGGQIKPGEFDRFFVSVGPLPDAALSFNAEQTYSDGTVVKWNEPQQAGTPEPEHPAPTLTLTAADGADGASTGGSSSDGTARALGIVGIVVGVLGLAAGVISLTRRPKPSTANAATTADADKADNAG